MPVFDPKGRYLYFLSNRDFNLTFSGWEFNYLYTNPTRVYVGLLAADGPAILLPASDEERVSDARGAADAAARPDRSRPPRRRTGARGAAARATPAPADAATRR